MSSIESAPSTGRRRAWLVACLAAAVLSCNPPADTPSPASPFLESGEAVGLDFVHFNGMTGQLYIAETLGVGAALFDYDSDGDLDVFFVQGGMLDDRDPAATVFPPDPGVLVGDRLYRNLLVEEGRLAFEDVTADAELRSEGYGMGVAAGDYDRDGWVDLYVTNFGANALWRNRGDGTFEEVTSGTGTGDPRWSTSAAFVDIDGDGWLDLFVTNYVDFSLGNHRLCFDDSSAPDYCGPLSYRPQPDRLYRNRGDGTFEDVSAASQIARAFGPGLGIVASDLTGDGRVDLFVANDGDPNQFWVNAGDGTFEDRALVAGCAFNIDGKVEASMGVDAADYDGDGDDDLFMTHLTDETNTLYVNNGQGVFEDLTYESGLGAGSRPYTGFGTAWIDYDNDGWLDLVVANGSIKRIPELAEQGDPYPLGQRNQLFKNLGGGRFAELSDEAGEAFETVEVSRGAAFGDLDNDGDTDVLILNNSGPARLLVNQVGNASHWVGFRVTGVGGQDAIGARVRVELRDGRVLEREVRVAASYCSSNDPRVRFGLGSVDEIAGVQVRWPGGTFEVWEGIEVDRYTLLTQGGGAPPGS